MTVHPRSHSIVCGSSAHSTPSGCVRRPRQGGIGPLGLATEDLHVLDLSSSTPRWHRVVVPNQGPGPRYAHVLALVAQRYLVTVGGNDGRQALEDVWALDTAAKPYQWQHIMPEGEAPVARMYATACARADGLLLLCGGREANNSPMVRESQRPDPVWFASAPTVPTTSRPKVFRLGSHKHAYARCAPVPRLYNTVS